MKLVIDCNILVSAARSQGVCGDVLAETVRNHHVVLSREIISEYRDVATRTKHVQYRHRLLTIINELEHVAEFFEPLKLAIGLHDTDDEIYLATAASANAVVITGNSRDFTKPQYGPVKVFSPRAFLDLIENKQRLSSRLYPVVSRPPSGKDTSDSAGYYAVSVA